MRRLPLVTTFGEMAVTETGHLASREVDDLYRRHGARGLSVRVCGARQPRRRGGRDPDDVPERVPLARAGRAAAETVELAAHDREQRDQAALPAGAGAPAAPSSWTTASQVTRWTTTRARASASSSRRSRRFRRSSARPSSSASSRAGRTPRSREILGVTTAALETLLFRARRSLAEELEHQLTCTDAQLAISKAVDGRLGRKERRRLRDHLVECPDCAHFARLQQRHAARCAGSCSSRSRCRSRSSRASREPARRPRRPCTVPATGVGDGRGADGVVGAGGAARRPRPVAGCSPVASRSRPQPSSPP